jgi:ATP-dependent exoDNAse (exonuclease V) beta subunit
MMGDSLSADGRQRLTSLVNNLTPLVDSCRRIPWRELIRNCWLTIGGPATASHLRELEYAESYFTLLDDDLSIAKLEAKLSSLSTPPVNPTANITAMTIHKAKGLEFDHVIIPSIHRTIRSNEHKLLLWHEQPGTDRTSNLILAPIENNVADDTIYNYLRMAEQKRSFYETGRLLYVAATRAKKSIHLTGTTTDDAIKFPKGSLLEQLEPVADIIETHNNIESSPKEANDNNRLNNKLERLMTGWNHPAPIIPISREHVFKFEFPDG